MISSLLRPKRGRTAREGDRSPFSSPYSGLRSSPVATRRPPAEERRRAGADFDNDDATNRQDDIDEEDEDHVDQEDEADEDEDGHGETTPLLPIFSAVHLGVLLGASRTRFWLLAVLTTTLLQIHFPYIT